MYPTIAAPYAQTPPPTLNVASIATHEPAAARVPASIVPPPVASTREENDAKRPRQNARESQMERSTQRASSAFIAQLLSGGNSQASRMTEYGFIPTPAVASGGKTSASQESKHLQDILDDQESLPEFSEGTPDLLRGEAAVAFTHLLEKIGNPKPNLTAVSTIRKDYEPALYQIQAASAYDDAISRIALAQSTSPQHIKGVA